MHTYMHTYIDTHTQLMWCSCLAERATDHANISRGMLIRWLLVSGASKDDEGRKRTKVPTMRHMLYAHIYIHICIDR